MITGKLPKARGNVSDPVATGLSLASDWWRIGREFFGPITKLEYIKTNATADYSGHSIENCFYVKKVFSCCACKTKFQLNWR